MKKIISFLIISIIFFACSNNSSNPIKPNPTGKSGEILVVINDPLWDNFIGDTIYYSLSAPFLVLPQDEPFFEVVNIPQASFKNIFKTHRNIIFIDIGPENQEPKLTKTTDKWSNSQLIYHFYAPNDTAFINLWNNNVEDLKKEFFKKDLNRYQEAFGKNLNQEAVKVLKEKYNISMKIPREFKLDVQKEHFCWISKETQLSSQGILIYDYPYNDTNTFTLDYIINKRDKITKKNVPGPNDGTYMQTEKQVPFETEEFYLNDNYSFLIRGLWYIENYFLGGPFVSMSVLDKKRNRIVTVEAYVYAGKQEKKLYLWQTESIIKTLKILD